MAHGFRPEWQPVAGQRLSSLLTFAYKVLFPTIWLSGFGLGTVLLTIDPPDALSPLLFIAGLIFGAAMFARWGFALKKVVAAEGGLVVSNYRREVFVPYEQISGVHENKLINFRPITVELRSPTVFGRFVFMPYAAFVFWADHPLATTIRERASAARQGRS